MVSAQTIFDIEIDKIYLDGEDVLFVNQGELSLYECSIVPMPLKDFQYKLTLQCEADNLEDYDTTEINFNSIKKFKKPKRLINWLKTRKFSKETHKQIQRTYLQYFDNNLIAELTYQNNDKKKSQWKFHSAEFWDYVFLRVNKSFLIVGLVYENDPDIGGFIIPTEEGAIIDLKGHPYLEEKGRIDSINLSSHINPNSFFRVKSVNDGYQLFDKLFQEPLRKETFKKITISDNFILGKRDNGITIHDKSGQKVLIKNTKAAYNYRNTLQFIQNDKIQCLDEYGVIHDTFPISKIVICGNFHSNHRKINQKNGLYRIIDSLESGYGAVYDKVDTTIFSVSKNISGLKFLNKDTLNYFNDYSRLGFVFSLPYNYYLGETPQKQQLIKLEKKKNHAKLSVIFEGELKAFGYYHPIKFKENKLYGYYPLNKNAKYQKLEKFDYYFAKFELPNGKSGWLDIYGNEYLKK